MLLYRKTGFLQMGLSCIFAASEALNVSVCASSPFQELSAPGAPGALQLPGEVLSGSHTYSECSLPSGAGLNTVK